MTALIAIVSHDRSDTSRAVVSRMQMAMSDRGNDVTAIWDDDGVVLGVQRAAWECAAHFAGDELLIVEPDVVVAADAALYYRDDLRQALAARGTATFGDTPGRLILAAYRAVGVRCAELLEGDFAFVVWDRRKRELVAARGISAVRPLHVATGVGRVLFASTVGGCMAHPTSDERLDLVTLAFDALGEYSARDVGTVFERVRQVAPGEVVQAPQHATPSRHRFWRLPAPTSAAPRSPAEAAETLRSLVAAATHERMQPDAETAIWMSGGFDSVGVFAIARQGRPANGLRPVSLAFPTDDTGYETPFVELVAADAGTEVLWADAYGDDFGSAFHRAAHRDEPFTAVHGDTVSALAARGAHAGMRVALNGHGGDGLFAASPAFLADLVARGRFAQALTEARAFFPKAPLRRAVRWGMLPLLPPAALTTLSALRRAPLYSPVRGSLPDLLRPDFVRRHALTERLERHSPAGIREPREPFSHVELRFFVENAGVAHWMAMNGALALKQGVEVRSPLLDPRIIRFVAAGPREERVAAGQVKSLLRAALAPFVPPEFVAPRAGRTGTLHTRSRLLLDSLHSQLQEWFQKPLLADLGLVEPRVLGNTLEKAHRDAWDVNLLSSVLSLGVCEAWLRARYGFEGLQTSSWGDLPSSAGTVAHHMLHV